MSQIENGSPEAAERLARDYMTSFVGADLDRLREILAEDVVFTWRFHESGNVEKEIARQIVGFDAVMAYAENGLTSVRYAYNDPEFHPSADGRHVYVETMATLGLPKDPAAELELVYRQQFVYRYDIREGKITAQVAWHNPVAALVFHTDRVLPTPQEIAVLGLPSVAPQSAVDSVS